MDYNGKFITILTICAIIYAFYYYNKDTPSNSHVYNSNSGNTAQYKIIIDPNKTDLKWYEKLMLKYAQHRQKKEEKNRAKSIMNKPIIPSTSAPPSSTSTPSASNDNRDNGDNGVSSADEKIGSPSSENNLDAVEESPVEDSTQPAEGKELNTEEVEDEEHEVNSEANTESVMEGESEEVSASEF